LPPNLAAGDTIEVPLHSSLRKLLARERDPHRPGHAKHQPGPGLAQEEEETPKAEQSAVRGRHAATRSPGKRTPPAASARNTANPIDAAKPSTISGQKANQGHNASIDDTTSTTRQHRGAGRARVSP
jgi:hypothetical protein